MTDTDQPTQLLTIDEVATWLGVSVRHVRRLVAEHRIPYLKWSRYLRFDPHDVSTWLNHARVPSTAATRPQRTRVASPTRQPGTAIDASGQSGHVDIDLVSVRGSNG